LELQEFLQDIPYLAALDATVLNELLAQLEVQNVADKHILIEEGTPGETIFLLLEGEVIVTSESSGLKQDLLRLKPGEFFGLMALVDDEPRAASCVASGPISVASLSREAYLQLSRKRPSLALALQRTLGKQLARDLRNITQRTGELLNALPAPTPEDLHYDVVVMGGGPLGMIYATWLKKLRPKTKVAVVERRDNPGHKVGESTLSTTVRAFQAMGLSRPILRRLFANKAGLRFFYTDESTDRLKSPLDGVDIEETYQVERRILEMALQETTSRMGVKIFKGTRVVIKESDINSPVKEIVCQGPDDDNFVLRCRVFCDASGSASALLRHLGLYRKDTDMYGTFNTNSYFAYFRPKQDLPVDGWQYPTTRHICFPDGWLWFITLTSWEGTPDDNIKEMINYLLDHPDEADESYLGRDEIAEKFGCQSEQIVSIGFTIRADRDVDKMPIQERFEHYVNKYSAIKWVLDHYELIEAPYKGKRRAYSAFMKMAHDAIQVAGDGWCVIGDAAVFTNPLFSPGLSYGTGTAYMAAKDTVKALDNGDVSRQAFATYEKYAHDIFNQILNETDMLHRSFNDEESYERVLACKIFFGALGAVPRTTYSDSDPFVFDLLNPDWVETVNALMEVQRKGEAEGTPPAEVSKRVSAIVDPFIEEIVNSPEFGEVGLGRFLNYYTQEGKRVGKKGRPRSLYVAISCHNCSRWADDSLQKCPYCGVPLNGNA
jgi:flavin-dependent dehydrogenase